MTSKDPVSKEKTVLIVGAGIFGLSTALELKKRGYQRVTVVDRYLPPVPDGSSVDISRVIRVDYADDLYAQMAREAQQGWMATYRDYYFESGFVMLANQPGHPYLEKVKDMADSAGTALHVHDDMSGVRQRYPEFGVTAEGLKAYVNERGGWADAEKAVQKLATECSLAGVSFITGPRGRVISVEIAGGRAVGVNVSEGPSLEADQVILATGAWTNRVIAAEHATSASGQPVGFIQLTQAEADKLRNLPVIINLSTGVFVFPPTRDTNVLKVARHGYGFATAVPLEGTQRVVSSPKRDSNGVASSWLPDDADQALRDGLRQLIPQHSEREWLSRRLCWYSDTPEGDFIIDQHPDVEGLFLATGGAGQ